MSTIKILVVEDELVVARDLRNRLTHLGYDPVASTATAEEGIKLAEALQPDLVLIDIHLAGSMDGVDGGGLIQKQFSIPVVFLTAYSDDATLERAKVKEPFGYIIKPFQDRELRTTIEMALYKAKMDRSLRESEEKYRTLFHTMGEGMVLHEMLWNQQQDCPVDYRILECNPAFETQTGLSATKAKGMLASEFYGVSPAPYLDTYAEVVRTSQPRTFETYFAPLQRHFIVSVFVPKPGWFATLFLDITARKQTEKALEEETNRRRALFEQSPVGILTIDPANGRILEFNAAAHRQLGYSRKEFGRLSISDVEAQETPEETKARIEGVVRDGHTDFETCQRTRQGELRNVQVTAHLVEVLGRKIYQCFWRDITERKKAEIALQESQETFSRAFHAGPLLMAIRDLETNLYVEVNEKCLTLSGYTRDEIIGRTPEQVGWTDPKVREQLREQLQRNGRILDFETTLRKKDGTLLNCLYSATIVTVRGRKHLISISLDITERKRVEIELRKLSQAVEQSPVSIVITDPQAAIEYVNPKFTQLTGYTLDELRGQNSRQLKGDNTSPEEYRRLWETITQGKQWQGQFHNRKKNGFLYWEQATISPILDAQGRITHFLAVKEDITERKRLEDQLRQAQKLESIGQLAGGVAHDFNNILAAIMMNMSLLQLSLGQDAEIQSTIQELMVESQRAANVVRQLLLFSRRSAIETKLLDLNDVVVNLLKMLGRLIGEHINMVFERQASLPTVEADPGLMEQVLMNLCVNARDAMANGGTLTISLELVQVEALRIRAHPGVKPGHFVCLSVGDTGCGIDEVMIQHIFEPFFTTKEVGRGTGLGLATVHGIVGQHKGWVEVESNVGAGSTFRVFLPAADQQPCDSAPIDKTELQRGHETILLVEDDASVRRGTAQSLRYLGYQVLDAADGLAALNLWSEYHQQVDLLLSDMVMPHGMTGLDLAEKLLKDKPGLKVIIASGYNAERLTHSLLSEKQIIRVQKPLRLESLSRIIRECLDRKV
jgi:two-component system, cell cycle sensor histidine kinase and response regulator CckA